jgi:hypothetical protein
VVTDYIKSVKRPWAIFGDIQITDSPEFVAKLNLVNVERSDIPKFETFLLVGVPSFLRKMTVRYIFNFSTENSERTYMLSIIKIN